MSKPKKASEVLRVVELVAKEQSECRREGYRWACGDLRDRVHAVHGCSCDCFELLCAEGKKRFSEGT